jgi:hypothetical protein
MFLNMFAEARKDLQLNVKNLIGSRTRNRIVVFSVDDYGNVRVDSRKARQQMDKAGLKILSRFDAYDSLEDKTDLEMLFDTLSSVKDRKGKNASFTAFAVPANINFEAMESTGYTKYIYEWLPETYKKLNGYDGTWQLWREGIEKRLLVPQFHGREHLNVKVFEEALGRKDPYTLAALRARSYTSIGTTGYSTISMSAAFDFWEMEENRRFDSIVEDGLKGFELVFGSRSTHFNPPGGREHPYVHKALKDNGIRYIDTPLIKREHQGRGHYRTVLNYTGKRNERGQLFMVRNVVFEPTDHRNVDWVAFALKQIEAAFRWNRPAVISSHRVNFCGHIDENNRKMGITALRRLLLQIATRWPDVEFMSATELCELLDHSSTIAE